MPVLRRESALHRIAAKERRPSQPPELRTHANAWTPWNARLRRRRTAQELSQPMRPHENWTRADSGLAAAMPRPAQRPSQPTKKASWVALLPPLISSIQTGENTRVNSRHKPRNLDAYKKGPHLGAFLASLKPVMYQLLAACRQILGCNRASRANPDHLSIGRQSTGHQNCHATDFRITAFGSCGCCNSNDAD